MPMIIIWSFRFKKKFLPLYQKIRSASAEIAVRLSGVFSGIQVVKSFNQEQAEITHLSKLSDHYVDSNKKAILTSSAFTPIIRIFILLGFLFTLVLGGYMCLNDQLGVGAYSALVYLTQRLLWPFTALGEIIDQYERAKASTGRIMGFIGKKSSKTLNKDCKKTQITKINSIQLIELKNLHFHHLSYNKKDFISSHSFSPSLNNNNVRILSGINLTIKTGQLIGICGATGCGKSTLVNLILQLYKPSKGTILYNNIAHDQLNDRNIRDHIAFVGQDTFLFDGTIKENICYGSTNITDVDLQDVLREVKLLKWINSLSHQLNTEIGERGVKLSGGQKQRIALARALLKNASVLVLDEATSAIDNESEKDIIEVIYRLAKNKIIIVIAHRLSTIVHADQIYLLADGKISEQGSHEQLIAIDQGKYKRLWHIQTSGGLNIKKDKRHCL